ncbi:MAG: glycosyl hydrolase family 5 [Deltaproteobacteria bacterium]|nr:glycosyl hydrolase family 5 [Deltaproteobacteria bacterium]
MAARTRWPLDTLDSQRAPVDLSFLNAAEKPAGKRGFVRADGERLVFADGTPARFWGTNVTARALFQSSRASVAAQARRLSALGFNLVRLHHHDSAWVDPNVFGERTSTSDTRSLSNESMAQLDWWITCLKAEGIYVWLDLHVGRAFRASDGITAFAELRRDKEMGETKGFNYVNASVKDAMKRFNEAYVGHVNSFTGLAYKDEPAIAAMLITNENDVTHHFGNALLKDKGVPEHTRWYLAEAEAFAHAHGLPADEVWRSWEPGPSKLFLNDLERRFGDELRAHLRGVGVKVPIATTSTWGNSPLSSLPALTAGDLIDVHAYGGAGQLETNPAIAANLVDWLAAGQVVGMPMTVTEWNAEPFPIADRHALPLYVASSASHQGWDALMHYAYTQEPVVGPGQASNWHAYNDPGLLATLPAAALLYRRGDVAEATSTFVLTPTREQLFFSALDADSTPALRTAAVKGKVAVALPRVDELPWLKPSVIPKGAQVLRDPAHALIDAVTSAAASDTGELRRDWSRGILIVDTPRTQVASGWIGGQRLALSRLQVALSTPHATVAVQSLDEDPLGSSRNLMVSLGARALPHEERRAPFFVEPVEGELRVRAPPGLSVFRHDEQQRLVPVPASYSDGSYALRLDGTLRTQWLFLRAAAR